MLPVPHRAGPNPPMNVADCRADTQFLQLISLLVIGFVMTREAANPTRHDRILTVSTLAFYAIFQSSQGISSLGVGLVLIGHLLFSGLVVSIKVTRPSHQK